MLQLDGIPREEILGVPVLDAAIDTVVEIVEAAIRERTRPPITVAFVNMHGVVEANDDADVERVFSRIDMPCPDGVSITVASRILRGEIRDRYSGRDILRRLLPKPGLSHYFLGSTPEVLQPLASRVRDALPETSRAEFESPPTWPWASEVDDGLIRRINDFKPDVVWVALSAPKQETWITEHAGSLDASVVAAIGYAFETFAGTQPLAPQWIRSIGCEWIYRFVHNPAHTWRRVFVVLPRFTFRVFGRGLKRAFGVETPGDRAAGDSSRTG